DHDQDLMFAMLRENPDSTAWLPVLTPPDLARNPLDRRAPCVYRCSCIHPVFHTFEHGIQTFHDGLRRPLNVQPLPGGIMASKKEYQRTADVVFVVVVISKARAQQAMERMQIDRR